MKHVIASSFMLALITAAQAQSVQQSGSVTRGHLPYWISSGVIGDAGTSLSSNITSMGVTNNGGPGICVNSAAQSSAGYNQLCFSATTNGGTKISSYAYGTASNPGLSFDINGSVQGFPAVTLPVVDAHAACFNGTTGLLKDCGFIPISGLIAPGHVIGNGSSTNPAQAADYSLSSVMVQALCATSGAFPI